MDPPDGHKMERFDEAGEIEEVDSAAGPQLEILRDPWGVIRRRWLVMLAAAMLGIGATAALVSTRTPTYLATARVLVASQKVSEDFVRPTIDEGPLEAMNAVLGEAFSQRNLARVIEEHELYPELHEALPRSAIVALMQRSVMVETEQSFGGPTREERTRLLNISFEAQDPEQAANVANALAQLLTDAAIRMRTQQARVTTDFMRRELEEAEQALRDQTREIAEFQSEHRGELPSELETSLRRLERLQEQRHSLAMQIAEAETRYATITAEDLSEESPQTRLESMRATLAEQRAIHTEAHPNVVSLRRQVEELERQIAPDSGAASARDGVHIALRREIDQLRQRLSETDAQLEELDQRVGRVPVRAEALAALEQRAQVLQETYFEFLRKVKEAELAESLELAQQGARVTVIDPAQPPVEPQSSSRKLAAVGVVASLGLAVALGLALELRDPILVSAPGVEGSSGLAVIGTVPRIG